MPDEKRPYRSAAWFAKTDKDGFVHRSWMRNQGLPDHVFDGRPVIGICNTWSELTPCNAHFRQIAERVKRGVWEAGGLPLEFPVMSMGETNLRPTAMLFRNLVSMDVEESIRGNPIDGDGPLIARAYARRDTEGPPDSPLEEESFANYAAFVDRHLPVDPFALFPVLLSGGGRACASPPAPARLSARASSRL